MSPESRHTGLYTPDDVLWQVNRELLVALAGSRALLLELAHPLVAAGVAQHSNFRRQPLLRLLRTLHMMQQLSFGSAEKVRNAARRVHLCHKPVRGTLEEEAGDYCAGTAYDAGDPSLRLWVFATLVDSILVTYACFVRPLRYEDKVAYYEDSKRMARRMGIPLQAMPPTFGDFKRYVTETLEGRALVVTPEAKDIVHALFTHPLLGPGLRLVSVPGMVLLPDRIRRAYGFQWGGGILRWVERFAALTQRVRGSLPDMLCVHPQAWLAEKRLNG